MTSHWLAFHHAINPQVNACTIAMAKPSLRAYNVSTPTLCWTQLTNIIGIQLIMFYCM